METYFWKNFFSFTFQIVFGAKCKDKYFVARHFQQRQIIHLKKQTENKFFKGCWVPTRCKDIFLCKYVVLSRRGGAYVKKLKLRDKKNRDGEKIGLLTFESTC